MAVLAIDEKLAAVMIKATRDGLTMAGLKPVPVGVGKYMQCRDTVTAIIGFVGPTSGSMTINTSEACACFLSGRMLGETLEQLDNQALDGLCEIANIIAGQIKAVLSDTEHRFDRISTPSVIVGQNYSVTHYRGMTSVTVDFELPEMPIQPGKHPIFSVNMCLMRL